MKKLASFKVSEVLKYLFNNPDFVIREVPKPGRKKNSTKVVWLVNDIQLTDSSIESMVNKGYIYSNNEGGYLVTEDGKAVGEMILGQRVYDFKQGMAKVVSTYEIDPCLQRIEV